jgi:hypothetical protein
MSLRQVGSSINHEVILDVLRADAMNRRLQPFRPVAPDFLCAGCGRLVACVVNEHQEPRRRYFTDAGRVVGTYSPVNVWHHACEAP